MACSLCARPAAVLTTLCTLEGPTRACLSCLGALRIPPGKLASGAMRCLLHLSTACCPAVPVHTYLSWLRRCLPAAECEAIAARIAYRSHALAARTDHGLQLMQCPTCGAYASLHSLRLRSWSTIQCGVCLAAACQRCKCAVPVMPVRAELLHNFQLDGVPWHGSHYKGKKGCACLPVSLADLSAQVRRCVATLAGLGHPVVDRVLAGAPCPAVPATPAVSAILALPPCSQTVEDASGGVPASPLQGMDVLYWLQDDVEEAAAAGDVDSFQDAAVHAWLTKVPSGAALYCMCLVPYWQPALRRLLPATIRLHPTVL